MLITTQKEPLLEALNDITKAVGGNNIGQPILQTALIKAREGIISVTGNCLELGIESVVQGFVIKEGAFCVDHKLLTSIVSKLPQGSEVNLECNEEVTEVRIAAGKSNFKIPVKDATAYPSLPEISSALASFEVEQKKFGTFVKGVSFCASSNGENKMMTCLHLDIAEGKASFVAIDGHRIGVRQTSINCDKAVKLQVKMAHASELSRVFASSKDTMKVCVTDAHLFAEAKDKKMVIRRLDGEYLNYQRMLAMPTSVEVTLSREELISTLDRAALIVGSSNIPTIFKLTNNMLEISATSTLGSMKEELSLSYEGAELVIGFNPYYLLELLKAINTEKVSMSFSNSKAPVYVKGEGYTYLVLPLSIAKAQAAA